MQIKKAIQKVTPANRISSESSHWETSLTFPPFLAHLSFTVRGNLKQISSFCSRSKAFETAQHRCLTKAACHGRATFEWRTIGEIKITVELSKKYIAAILLWSLQGGFLFLPQCFVNAITWCCFCSEWAKQIQVSSWENYKIRWPRTVFKLEFIWTLMLLGSMYFDKLSIH